MKPLIVFGCPVANRAWILNDWLDAIELQVAGDEEHRWRPVCVYTPSEDDTEAILRERHVVLLDGGGWSRPVNETVDHRWPIEHFEHMARWRNQLLDYCIEVEAEWFFSVDSDIILPPGATKTLLGELQLALKQGFGAIAPLVNMATHLDAGSVAWNWMDWVDGRGVSAQAYRSGRVMPEHPFRVDVIMAAMLIHRTVFKVKWHEHEQGEDIGWSYNAAQQGVRLAVDPTVVCNHIMRPR